MKIIASWGTSGAGKTTIALAVAAELVRRHKDVLVIGTDTKTPMLPVYLPNNNKLDRKNSLGPVFEQAEVTEGALKDKMIQHPQSDRLYFMGLASGELSGITYKVPDRTSILSLFDTLRQSPFSYCIVDCDSNPVLEPVTLLSLELADIVLRTTTPDVRGHESMLAQLHWLGNSEDTFHIGRHIRLISPVYDYTPLAEFEALEGPAFLNLPWAVQVAERQLAGQLLHGFDSRDGLKFERMVASLVDRIEGDTHHG